MDKEQQKSALHAALAQVVLPGTQVSLAGVSARLALTATGSGWQIQVGLPLACESLWPDLRDAIAARLAETAAPDAPQFEIELATIIPSFGVRAGLQPLPGIANLIAVASGKGGVGKSTTALNLALALVEEGARVGLLDADIYGPSIPRMTGLLGRQPESPDGKSMLPLEALGLQIMSIGFLVDETAPTVWRGPMVTSALNQLLKQTRWRDLDYLIIDMPPGTGDIQLTLSQSVPVSGALVVTTPQDVALSDARKGLEMFRKVSVPVLGVVENMSVFICPSCDAPHSLFGQGGGERLAAATGVTLLGELPLQPAIGAASDAGEPIVASDPLGAVARVYRQIAISTGLALAASKRDYSAAFANIVVEDS